MAENTELARLHLHSRLPGHLGEQATRNVLEELFEDDNVRAGWWRCFFSHPTEWQGFKAASSPFFLFPCGTAVNHYIICTLMICIELQLSRDAEAAVFSIRPEDPVIVDQNFGSEVTQVLQFPGTNGPVLSIFGSTFYFFYIDDANTSLLVRSSASPVNYTEFRGYAAALAAGSLIGTSSWLVDEPHVDAWGEARWGVHDNWVDEVHPQRDYFTSDTPLGGEMGLQDVPAFQNPGQLGGRYFCGLGWKRGDDFNYGWMELQGVGGTQMSILAWAWESTPNMPIAAGAIPEPSAFLLFVGGSFIIIARRRRPACLRSPTWTA